MGVLDRLAKLAPATLTRRLARNALPLALVLIAAVLLAGVAVAALVSPGALGLTAARLSETRDIHDALGATLEQKDADGDGLSDSLENYLYGTDPTKRDSSGLGIPDGWLVQYGYDPLSPATGDARGVAPPKDQLPVAYKDGYPLKYTPPLADYYAFGKPADERVAGTPWWRSGPSADPSKWDQAGSGIPTGWLLHYGLDVNEVRPDLVVPGSLGNLTLRQAFTYDVDPKKADSDGDGLDDWAEIHVHRTNPARFSTSGAGIADGWLLRYGLNPFDADAGTQDPDLDGLTNQEEFSYSLEALRDDVAREGVKALFARGLDPLEWETAKTGIPDGWYVKYGLSPFGADANRVIGRASDFAGVRDLTSAPEGLDPIPDLVMTVREAYGYLRPADYNESVSGVYWGGTNPVTLDTDNDGLPDPVEIRGWYGNATFEAGPKATGRTYNASSNPLEADSDGDGLSDLEEYLGVASCPAAQPGDAPLVRSFPRTNPRNRDTAFSGLTDFEKVCFAVRGESRYDLRAQRDDRALDPTRADSAGDYMTDGARLDFWANYAATLRTNPKYPYNGTYGTVFDFTERYARFAPLSRDQVLAQFRPDGDVDNDGIVNVLDADPSGGLHVDRFGPPGGNRTDVFFLGGPQMDPSLYRFTELASSVPHVATDPANPDTDGDGLPDAWETRYGRFDPALGGWNLDPANPDSDRDDIPDGADNNDGDVITWYAHSERGGRLERTAHAFDFTNLLEFQAGTNPNELSTSNDAVPDGWKAFWGSRVSAETFPNLLSNNDERVGTLALRKRDEIENAMASSPIQPAADLKNRGTKATGYVRFVPNLTFACASERAQFEALLKPGEELPPDFCYQGEDLEGKIIRVARIEGISLLTFRREAELRTNPYLVDTDDDGAPDAYEAYYGVRGTGASVSPDPTLSDGDRDIDNDGIALVDECRPTTLAGGVKACGHWVVVLDDGSRHGAGASPHLPDTDGDGIQDGIEATAGLDPLNPADVAHFRDPTRDRDGDGVPDFQELTGWGKLQFGTPARTNADDPDTDGDGLLDGSTLILRPGDASADLRIAAFKARGIAHRVLPNGSISFFGENATYSAASPPKPLRPDTLDSSGLGVPDGWLAYYLIDPADKAADVSAYALDRPSWWQESRHGVWWWGRVPGTSTAPRDADADGLDAVAGEDPFPALRLNRIVDGAIVVDDPRDVQAYVDGAATQAAARERAQRLGDAPGDPQRGRAENAAARDVNGVLTSIDRAKVAIVDVKVWNASLLPTGNYRVTKGVAFNLSGRVVLDERNPSGTLLQGTETERVGVANRTVLVGAFAPLRDRAVGAGFTNETGWFNVTVNVSAEQRYAIPAKGAVLLGQLSGLVGGVFDPTVLATGTRTGNDDNRLIVWTTNTTATVRAGHATHGTYRALLPDAAGVVADRPTNATRFATSASIPITVFSDSVLAKTVNALAVNGEKLIGDIVLTDAGGSPVVDKAVFVSFDGSTPPVSFNNLTTNRNGVVNLTNLGIRVGVERADTKGLYASFVSTDPYLSGRNRTFSIDVVHPVDLAATATQGNVTVGESVEITGQLRTRAFRLGTGAEVSSSPIGGAEVTATLGGASERTRTDDRGMFTLRLSVPGSLAAGEQAARIAFAGDPTHAPAEATARLAVKRTAQLADLVRLEGPRAEEATLRGRLIDNEGQGFAGAIDVYATSGKVGAGRAGNDGRFTIRVPLSLLPLGTGVVRVTFPGDAGHAPAENFTQARVTSTTILVLEGAPSRVVRGQGFDVAARLLDDQRAPVAGQAIRILWQGLQVETLVTDERGEVRARILTNASQRPSVSVLALDFTPGPTAVLTARTLAHDVEVVQGSRLEFGDRDVRRGSVEVAGRLLDDEGRPIPAALLAVDLDGKRLGETRTARNGSFSFPTTLEGALGSVKVRARYDGTASIAAQDVNVTWRVRSPLTVDLEKVGPFVRGENAPIKGTVVDDRGKPADVSLRLLLAGRDLGNQRTTAGALSGLPKVPADLARGDATLLLRSDGTEKYEPFVREVDVVVKIRPKVQVELPALAVRGLAFSGDVLLRDDKGEPLRNTSFAYVVGKNGQATLGQTDAEGRASLASVAPLGGDTFVSLTVRGGEDVVASQYKTPTLRVVGPETPVGYVGLAIAVLVVLGVLAAVVVAALLRRRQLGEVRDIVEEAMRDLIAGSEYGATIFLAYKRLAAHMARHGFAEKAHETPREFALGIRKALPLGGSALKGLIQVFEEAKYSDHAMGSEERDRAVECLAQVRNELDAILGRQEKQAVA